MPLNNLNTLGDGSDPQIREGFSPQGSPARLSTPKRICLGKGLQAAVGIGGIALSAAVFFRVRDLLAALLLFRVLFGAVAIAVFILWLVGRATHEVAARVGTHLAHMPSSTIFVPVRTRANHHGSPPWN
jgi:hypothetical protein